MPDFVILRVNQLGSGQTSPLTFQDCLGNDVTDNVISLFSYSPPPINHDIPSVVDEPVKIPGVDSADQQDPSNQNKQNNDFDITPPKTQAFKPEPPIIEPSVELQPAVNVAEAGVQRSSHTRQQVERYIPLITGKKYSYTAVQLANKKYDHLFAMMAED